MEVLGNRKCSLCTPHCTTVKYSSQSRLNHQLMGMENIARSAVDVQQDGVAPVLPADRDPLIDPADLHRFEALDPVWRDNPARLGDDLGGVVAVARSGRLRICGGLDHRWERRAQRQPRQAGGDEKSSVHGLLPASSL